MEVLMVTMPGRKPWKPWLFDVSYRFFTLRNCSVRHSGFVSNWGAILEKGSDSCRTLSVLSCQVPIVEVSQDFTGFIFLSTSIDFNRLNLVEPSGAESLEP